MIVQSTFRTGFYLFKRSKKKPNKKLQICQRESKKATTKYATRKKLQKNIINYLYLREIHENYYNVYL